MDEKTAVVKAEQLPARADRITPVELIQHALDSGTSADQLEKLVGLHERMSDRESAKEFIVALAKFQSECPPIIKDKTVTVQKRSGGSYSYNFSPLDHMVPIISPHLLANGFSYSWDTEIQGGQAITTCKLAHINGHTRESKFSCSTQSANPGMSEQQKAAGAVTFGRRQSLVQVLGLVTADRDTDMVPQDKIDESQEAHLKEMISEVKVDIPRFLKYFGITKLEDMTTANYGNALRLLEQKRKES